MATLITMKVFKVAEDEHTQALGAFIAQHLNVSKKRAKALLDERVVFVNGRRTWIANHQLASGDKVEVHVEESETKTGDVEVRILYQDEFYFVFNKEPGVLSNGPDSLESAARIKLNLPGLVAVHRIDKDTTGCILFARDEKLKRELEDLFRTRKIEKSYRALVHGNLDQKEGEVRTPIEDKPALTRYFVLHSVAGASFLKIDISTGRMHQIRKHMALLGHPLYGEKAYQNAPIKSAKVRAIARQMLHARSLQFESPRSGKLIKVQASLPDDFRQCADMLGLRLDG